MVVTVKTDLAEDVRKVRRLICILSPPRIGVLVKDKQTPDLRWFALPRR
jgi:hypothetical protein